MSALFGHGATDRRLSVEEVEDICEAALTDLPLDSKRVLVLIPDHTRHAPIALFFRILSDRLLPRVHTLDYLVATGTHAPMEPERLYRHLGLSASEHRQKYARVRLFNHEHHRRDELVAVGTLPGAEVSELTHGLFSEDIPVTINKKATEYDHILIVSPVVPHESVGFAGGNKYFFPGIAGIEVIEKFHWLAAVITNPLINGVKDTPTRKVIDRVAGLVPVPRTCFAFVVDDHQKLACLFAGPPEEAWSRAADYSAELHVKYLDKPVKRVLGLTPPIYEEMWVAGKAMYKLEPIVADGGELVIHGPHIKTVSFVHGKDIARVGYHVRDYFLKQWDRFAEEPMLILAHSTNVKGIGSFENGIEEPRVTVTLATGIARPECEAVNLAFRDVRAIDVERWRHEEDTLVVEEAGQVLYRLREPNASRGP
jgi:nickel-dependent lactate racemase